MAFRFAFAVLALVGAAHAAPAAARTLTLDDMRRIVVLQQPAIAPGGSQIALIVQRDERNALVLVDAATGAQTILARGGGVADPRWSPDGSAIAYLQQDRSGGHLQLFVTSHRGTRQLTHAATDVIDAAWSPDGKTIAFAANVRLENPGYFDAGDNDYTAGAVTPPVHLWLIQARGGQATQLTGGSWTIAPTDSGGIFSPQFAWSHDGGHIVFTRVASTFTGDDEYSTLWSVDTRTRALHKLTRRSSVELTPSFSPNGRDLLYWYARDGNFLAFNTLRFRRGNLDRDLTARFDYNVGGALWMPDGRSMLVCANERTLSRAWILSLDGSAQLLELGDLNVVCDSYQDSTFDAGIAASVSRTGAIAFLATTATHARELYYLPTPHDTPRRLTHFNDDLARLQLGVMREIRWRGRGGFIESGVLTFPPAMVRGRKYPILVNIHGGPGQASLRSFVFESWPRAQLFAARGYIVFEPNYRGSDGDGNTFILAIVRDTVSGPADDILRGLAVVRALPQADAARIAVSGWSYGGLLTSWLITQHHFWRAAVSGAAVNDEINEYATSTSNVQDRYYLGTSPYAKGGAAVYAAQSPVTFAERVTTPTLIWATTLDPVVPIPQAYEFYHALREHHVPVRFVVFPATTHGPADAAQTAELTRLWLQWLDRYVRR